MGYPNDRKATALSWLLVSALCASSHVARAEQHITCPVAVDARQVQVDAPTGWTGGFGLEGSFPLRGVQAVFVVGSLRDSAWGELKDPPFTKKGDSVITTYPLPPETDKYVICSYGERIYQAMKLPSTTKQCEVIRRPEKKKAKGKENFVVADVVCR